MKKIKLNRKALIRDAIGSVLVFAAMLVFLHRQESPYLIQNTLFMTGFLYIMLTLLRISLWTGFFDLFTYGFEQVAASFKRQTEEMRKSRVPFFEYTRAKERTIAWESGLVGAAYWSASLVIRLFTKT